MDIELRELSAIYLQNLQEEEEGGGADVGAHAKAIRYQSRRDGVPLPKAFNAYVAKNQLSGTERTALRQKLGFMGEETEVLDEKKGCNHSHEGEECPVHGKKECSVKEEDDYGGPLPDGPRSAAPRPTRAPPRPHQRHTAPQSVDASAGGPRDCALGASVSEVL